MGTFTLEQIIIVIYCKAPIDRFGVTRTGNITKKSTLATKVELYFLRLL